MSKPIRITTNELVEELRRSIRPLAPPGAMTAEELRAATGMKTTQLRIHLKKLEAEGRLKTWMTYRPDSKGRDQQVPAYSIVSAKR